MRTPYLRLLLAGQGLCALGASDEKNQRLKEANSQEVKGLGFRLKGFSFRDHRIKYLTLLDLIHQQPQSAAAAAASQSSSHHESECRRNVCALLARS